MGGTKVITTALVVGGIAAAGSIAAGAISAEGAKKAGASASRAANAQNALAEQRYGAAQASLAESRSRNTALEGGSAYIQNALGTPEQLSGMPNSGYLEPYQGRYTTPDVMSTAGSMGIKNRRVGPNVAAVQNLQARSNTAVTTANQYMATAQGYAQKAADAKAAGDMAGYEENNNNAIAYKNSAESLMGQNLQQYGYGGPGGMSFNSNLSLLSRDTNYTGYNEELRSPMGQTVGNLVKAGRDVAGGPGTEGYNKIENYLTKPYYEAERDAIHQGTNIIAAGLRTSEGQAQDLANQRGSARSLFAERDYSSNLQMSAAQQRSNLVLGAHQATAQAVASTDQFLLQWAPAFGAASVDVGRAFAQGSPYINQYYRSAMDSLSVASANLANAASQQANQMGAMYNNQSIASQQASYDYLAQGIQTGANQLVSAYTGAMGGKGMGAGAGTGGGNYSKAYTGAGSLDYHQNTGFSF